MTVILCADDDLYTLYSLWKSLKAEGFTVLTASNGPAALEISRRHLGPIDLLITTITQPRMNGVELSEAIQAERPSVKVLLMSLGRSGDRAGVHPRPTLPSEAVHRHNLAGSGPRVARLEHPRR